MVGAKESDELASMGGVSRRVGPNHTPCSTLLCHRVRVSWHSAQLLHQHQVHKSPMQLPVQRQNSTVSTPHPRKLQPLAL